MKNVCFFSGDITRSGGTEKVTVQIASELANMEEQFNISIISLMESAEMPFYGIPDKISRYVILSKSVTPINRAISKFLYILFKLVHFIRHNKIDIIIDVDGILDVFSLPAKLFTKVKVITWEHFNYYTDLGNNFRTYLKKVSARFSDYIIVLTEEDKGYYKQNLTIKCPIDFIYNPINMHSNNIYNTASKNIFSAGRLTQQKGFDLLVEAARIVFEEHDDWSWTIAGDGEDRQALEKKIREYGLTRHIHLLGNIKNMEDYYANSAMFVLTSRFEGFGLVVAEAKRFRLPVVSFECKAGPKELILHQQNGFLIDCFDVKDMADKIKLLIEDEQLRKKFSDTAHADTEKFSYHTIMQKWIEVLYSL